MNNRLVSIITSTYNCVDFVDETIESILAQTYNNWELLITDDCSTDETWNLLQKYAAKDARIKIFRLEENSGAGVARNNSIKEAKGRYIAFCDSDDRWYPEKLEKQLKFMEEHDCAMSHTSYLKCDEDNNIIGVVICRRLESFKTMCKDDKMGFLTVMIDSDKVGKVCLPDLRKRQDWAYKLKVLKICGQAYGMKEPLAYYRIRSNSISRKKLSLIKYNIAVYREVLGWSYIKSHLYFFGVFAPHHLLKRLFLWYLNK